MLTNDQLTNSNIHFNVVSAISWAKTTWLKLPQKLLETRLETWLETWLETLVLLLHTKVVIGRKCTKGPECNNVD